MSIVQSMEPDSIESAHKRMLSQEYMRMSRPKPPKKNLLKFEANDALRIPLRTVSEWERNQSFMTSDLTCVKDLIARSADDKNNALHGIYKFSHLSRSQVRTIINYCSSPDQFLPKIVDKPFETLCGLWVAADFLQPRESKINENNNNAANLDEKKDLLFLKKQIEKAIAQQLSENISDETIEAVEKSHLPSALEDSVKGHLNRTIQSFTGKLTDKRLFGSILPLEVHISDRGNFVFTTKKDSSEIGIFTVEGKELGHCLGYRNNPPISISGNEQYYAFATDHETITMFELPGLNEVCGIKIDDTEGIEIIRISNEGNYVVYVEKPVYGMTVGNPNKLRIHNTGTKKTCSLNLYSHIRAIEFSNDEKYLGVLLMSRRTATEDRFIWLLDQGRTERILDSKTDALAFRPKKNGYATYEENRTVWLSDFDRTRKIFELQDTSSCALSFDQSGDYLIAQCCTNYPDKSNVSIFSLLLNKMIKNAIVCDSDSPVSIIGDSVLVKDNKKLIVHSLTSNETRIIPDDFKSIVVSKDGKMAIIENYFNFFVTKLEQELPANLKLHELLACIKADKEKPGSGAQLLKKIEAKEQSKNQNSEKKDAFDPQRTVKYSRPIYPAKRPQEKYVSSSFDINLDNAGNEKKSGKDEEKDGELS